MDLRLVPSEGRHLVLARLEHVEAAAGGLRDVPQERGKLHEYRRSTRRLEAAIATLEPALNPPVALRARSLANGLARGLGRHRDADVVQRLIEEASRGATGSTAGDLGEIRRGTKPKGRARAADVEKAVKRARKRDLRRPLEDMLDRLNPEPVDPLEHAQARVRVRLRAARKQNASEHALHALRLEAKLFRYALEELTPLDPAFAAPASQAGDLTDALGRITDARALRAAAAAHAETRPDGARVLLAHADAEAEAGRAAFAAGLAGEAWAELKALLA